MILCVLLVIYGGNLLLLELFLFMNGLQIIMILLKNLSSNYVDLMMISRSAKDIPNGPSSLKNCLSSYECRPLQTSTIPLVIDFVLLLIISNSDGFLLLIIVQ